MPGAVTVGQLIVNLSANTADLKSDLADSTATVKQSAQEMTNAWAGVTAATGSASAAGRAMVASLKEQIDTFGMTEQQILQYKANLNGVGTDVQALAARLDALKSSQAAFGAQTDALAQQEAAATVRIREMVAASLAESAALEAMATGAEMSSAANLRLAAATGSASAASRLWQQNMAGVSAAIKGTADQSVVLSAATQKVLDRYDPLGTKLRSLQSDLGMLQKEMGNSVSPAAIRAFQGLEDEIAKTSRLMSTAGVEGFEEAGAAATRGAGMTAGATRELMVLGHEALSGNFSRMPGSFMVLAERMSLTEELLNPLTIGMVALGAAAVGMVASYVNAHNEMVAMNTALAVTNNYAGMTRGSMHDLADSMSQSGMITIGVSKDIVTALVASGRIGAESISTIAHLASDYAKATGEDVAQIAPKLIQLFSDPLHGAQELDKAMHFLNAADLEQIETLVRLGDVQQAQLILSQKLTDQLPKQEMNVTVLDLAYNKFKGTLSQVNDVMGQIFAGDTFASALKQNQSRIDLFTSLNGIGGMDFSKEIAGLKQLNIELENRKKAEQDAATGTSESTAQMERQKTAIADVNKSQLARIGQLKEEAQLVASAPDSAEKSSRLLEIQKEIAGAYRAIGADARAASQEQITQQQALSEIKLKASADEINTDYQLGRISKQQFDAQMTNNQLEVIGVKELYELRMSMLTGLTANERQAHHDKLAQLQAEFDLVEQKAINGPRVDEKKAYDEMIAALDKAGQSSLKSLDDQIAKEQKHALEIGHTREQIDLLMKAEQDKATAQMQNDANAIEDLLKQQDLNKVARGIYEEQLDQLNAQIEKRKILSGLKGDAAAAEAAAHDLAVSKKLADQTIQDWKNVGTSISEALTSAFGSAGHAAGGMFKAYADNAARQLQINKELAIAATKKDGDPTKIREIDDLRRQSGQAQVKSYADMADAAQGFFEQGSKGYEAMHAASVVLHGAEVALSLIKGVNAVLTQGEGDPYSAFVRMAAMAAIVTGLGVAISGGGGGGGGQSAADVQKAQGTGSVFGDVGVKNQTTGVMGYVEKSDSVRHAIEGLKANSDSMLPINQAMLTALQSIEASMVGLTNLVVRTPGLTDGTNMGIKEGQLNAKGSATDFVSNFMTQVQYVFAGPILGGKLAAIGNNLWGKITQNIVDSGIMYGGGVRGLQAGKGFDQYASVDTTKSSWFGLSKSTSNSVQTQGLNNELSQQFGLIFTNLDKSLQAASVALGGSAEDVTKVLDNLTLESTKVSLKGLTGTALTDALNSVISKSMDEIAQAAFPQLDQFRKVGEGYAETVVRIAGDYAKLDAILAGSSTTFGTTGMASIAARERLIELAGGIDQLASQSNSFDQNFLSKAEQLAPVQKYVTDQLAAMGLQGIDTRDKFKDVVLGLANSGALATEAGAKEYTALLALADAFSKTHAATVDLTKSEQEIADERKGLQDQLNQLTMTQAQLATKARDAIDAHNQALYDQVQAAQAAKDALQASLSAAQGLLDAAGQAYSNLQTVVGKQKDALNASYQTASDALMTGINSVTGAVSKLQSLSQALHTTLDSMSVPGQEKADRQAAQAQIEAALVIAKAGGPLPDVADLQKALSTVGKDASGQFGSYLDYQRDLYRTKNNVSGLAGYTDAQLSIDQLMLKSLQDQKTALDVSHKQDLAALDAILGQAKNQVDALNGISTSLMTLPQALAAIAAAIAAVQANPIASGGPAVTAAYQQYLGRAPEAGAVDYWKGQIGQGVDAVGSIKGSEEAKIQDLYKSLLGRTGETAGVDSWEKAHAAGQSWDQIKQGFMNSTEYKALHPPGFADGGSHMGGLRMVGEDGPEVEATGPSRIWNASQMRDAMNGGSNDALAAEVRALRAEVSQMRAAAERTATSTEKVEKVITRVGGRGDYFTTKEVV